MRIVDVSAFYTPEGGGVRTYVERKLKAIPALGHEVVVVVPGKREGEENFGPGARIVTVEGPAFPLDKRYHYFKDEEALHQVLTGLRPDFVEASSPWSSASMVGRWPGAAPRAAVMHSDPLSAYAYRYLDPLMPREWIDKSFDWFWQHLRRLDGAFELIVCASRGLTRRFRAGGLTHVETIAMGVEPGAFSPQLRDEALRASLLQRCQLPDEATLLIGAGRLSKEKRWPMVVQAAIAAGGRRPVGLLLVGDGRDHGRVVRAAGDNPHVQLLAPTRDRQRLARLFASADALVHGCEAETFGMVPAEAKASGLPIIVPDEGGASDQIEGWPGEVYESASGSSLAKAIVRLIDRGLPELRAEATARAGSVMTMDDHFARLVARYQQIAAGPALVEQPRWRAEAGSVRRDSAQPSLAADA